MKKDKEKTFLYLGIFSLLMLTILNFIKFENQLLKAIPVILFLIIAIFCIKIVWELNELNRKKIHRENRELKKALTDVKEIISYLKEGDLSFKVDPEMGKGIFKDIYKEIKETKSNITSLLKKIQKTSARLSNSAQNITMNSSELSSGSAEEAASVTEITSTMEELSKTAKQISNNSKDLASFTEKTEKEAKNGSVTIAESISSLNKMNEKIKTISENAYILGEKFHRIDKILEIITSIASETHILALNASIEAASAGEFGDRFSVIAQEVRKLAAKSKEAVEEIKNIFGELQKSIEDMIMSTEDGYKEFETASQKAKQIQDTFLAISKAVESSTQFTKEISLATQQQTTATNQVAMTLKDISTVAKQTAEAIKEFNEEANNLNEIALETQLTVQNFIIPSDRNIKFLAKNLSSRDEVRNYQKKLPKSLLEEFVEKHKFVEIIFITNLDGHLSIFHKNPDIKMPLDAALYDPNLNLSHRPWFYSVVETKKPFISEPYTSLLTQEKCITVSAPIFNEENDLIGVLGIDINAYTWSKLS